MGIFLEYQYDNFYVNQVFSFLDFDTEDSVPTVFSFLLLFVIAIILFVIHQFYSIKKYSKHWLILSLVFFFLSFDEIISIHENFIPLLKRFKFTGLFYFSWIIPYAIFVIILFIYYFPFLLGLPKKNAIRFILSGIIYIAGAIGIEGFEGMYFEKHGYDLNFSLLYTIEEFLEMIGLSLFLFSIIEFKFDNFTIQLVKK
ncbi:hypothetical protein [Maribacter sp. ACAM166]|uniref:hypothetical protein n=1 Tax=Maribacter sp. ACAM166 TaxID=2508996 RepID=UPI0010FD9324|nr:hypothetical protein [Maribacter sp. ACAM166]TLP79248.1 hypothetical protein ES765_10810 [Maribacter sp. ACAM166]